MNGREVEVEVKAQIVGIDACEHLKMVRDEEEEEKRKGGGMTQKRGAFYKPASVPRSRRRLSAGGAASVGL